MTIQEQLAAFAAHPVVDGVRWNPIELNNNPQKLGFCTTIIDVQIEVMYYPLRNSNWLVTCNLLLPSKLGVHLKEDIPTPADACREALRLCRERVAELAGALGLFKSEMDIKQSVIELLLYAEKDGTICNGFRTQEIINNLQQLLNQPEQGAKENI